MLTSMLIRRTRAKLIEMWDKVASKPISVNPGAASVSASTPSSPTTTTTSSSSSSSPASAPAPEATSSFASPVAAPSVLSPSTHVPVSIPGAAPIDSPGRTVGYAATALNDDVLLAHVGTMDDLLLQSLDAMNKYVAHLVSAGLGHSPHQGVIVVCCSGCILRGAARVARPQVHQLHIFARQRRTRAVAWLW
jgi:hypothetical protein